MVIDGKEYASPRVRKNCATLLDMFNWKLGECGVDSEAAPQLSGSATASEADFCRVGSRIAIPRPRASSFSADVPPPACPGSWAAFEAAQPHWLSLQLPVVPARLRTGLVTFSDLRAQVGW